MTRLTYDSDRLIREWRARYTNRRTIAAQMLDDAEALVRDAIARELEQTRREAKTAHEWDLERRETAASYAEARHERERDRLRRELAEAKEKISSLSPRVTLMRAERETVEDGTVVRIHAPRVPGYSAASSSVRHWQLAEVEELATRIRMAGAGDEQEVRFQKDHVEVCVPFPEYALPAPTPPHEDPPAPREKTGPGARQVAAAVALVVLLGLVLAVLGMVLL